MKKKIIQVSLIVLLVSLALYRLDKQKPKVYQNSMMAMGTYVTIDVVGPKTTKEIVDSAFSIINYYDSLFSMTNPASELNKINKNKNSNFKLSNPFKEIFLSAKNISKLTDGAFDITIGIISQYYDFVNEFKPDNSILKEKISYVDYKKLKLYKNQLVKKDKEIVINLGGIAKGYIIDKVRDYFFNNNINNFVINAGGDIYLTEQMDGSGWKIGIRHPRKKGDLLGNIIVKNKAVVTSGDYEQFFYDDSTRIHHIINPKTGLPANQSISVTVIAEDATLADAMCTALFVMGPKEGIQLANQTNNIEVIFLSEIENELYYSTSNRIGKYNFELIDKTIEKLK